MYKPLGSRRATPVRRRCRTRSTRTGHARKNGFDIVRSLRGRRVPHAVRARQGRHHRARVRAAVRPRLPPAAGARAVAADRQGGARVRRRPHRATAPARAIDGDVELTREAARAVRRARRSTSGSRRHDDSLQGAGTAGRLPSRRRSEPLPIPCPRIYDPTSMALVPVAGCPLTFAFPARPHGARRLRRSAVAPEQEADLRRRRSSSRSRPTALGTLGYAAQRRRSPARSSGTSSRTGT